MICKINHKSLILKILLVFIAFSMISVYGQSKGLIYNSKHRSSDTIDFGVCYIGDSLESTFVLRNIGKFDLWMNKPVTPAFLLGKTSDQPILTNDFEEFSLTNYKIPIIVDTLKKIVNLKFQYKAKATSSELIKYPVGLKKALLHLGLLQTYDSIDAVVERNFIIYARKTTDYIYGANNWINFDSIFLNSNRKLEWIVQSRAPYPIAVESQTFSLHTPLITDDEYKITIADNDISFPVVFPESRNTVSWDISYTPKNLGKDIATLKLAVRPDPVNHPDSLIYPTLELFACGVEQKIELDNSIYENVKIYGDTIDFGDIRIGNSSEMMVILNNKGNIPFGLISQEIMQHKNCFDFKKQFLSDNSHLQPNNFDTLRIAFSPKQRIIYNSEYQINSDITERDLYGYTNDMRTIKFYLRGRGIEPEISVAKDTIDFGNIVLSSNCTSERDTIIPISNLGNMELKINSIYIYPESPKTPFSVENKELIIPADNNQIKMDSIKIIFSSNEEKEFYATLFLINNSSSPKDTIKITLHAKGVPPVSATLRIPDNLTIKPGHNIQIPIIIDNKRVSYARNFSDTLTYNKTILKYDGYNTPGTASEIVPDDNIIINEIENTGRLAISIKTPSNAYFLKKDTLILLNFKAFLGDKIYTQISFASPVFGDGKCNNVLNTNEITNGILFLDSICGISLKTIPYSQYKFAILSIDPNPVTESFSIAYQMAFASKVTIKIYDMYGREIIELLNNELPSGVYSNLFNAKILSPGTYFCEMRAGIFKETKILVINR